VNHADVFTFGANQADFRCADFFVDARASVSLGRRIMRSAGYDSVPSVVAKKVPGMYPFRTYDSR
jgi:hypothetical protein